METGIHPDLPGAAATPARRSGAAARRRALIPLGLALALFALCTLGEADPGGWVAIRTVFDRWILLGTTGVVLLVLASCLLRTRTGRGRTGKVIAVLLSVLLAAVWTLGLISQGLVGQHLRVVRHVTQPGNSSNVLIVRRGSDLIDTVYALSIKHGTGLFARERRFACINQDAAWISSPPGWSDPTHVAIEVSDDVTTDLTVVRVDADGTPHGDASNWDGCQD